VARGQHDRLGLAGRGIDEGDEVGVVLDDRDAPADRGESRRGAHVARPVGGRVGARGVVHGQAPHDAGDEPIVAVRDDAAHAGR